MPANSLLTQTIAYTLSRDPQAVREGSKKPLLPAASEPLLPLENDKNLMHVLVQLVPSLHYVCAARGLLAYRMLQSCMTLCVYNLNGEDIHTQVTNLDSSIAHYLQGIQGRWTEIRAFKCQLRAGGGE